MTRNTAREDHFGDPDCRKRMTIEDLMDALSE